MDRLKNDIEDHKKTKEIKKVKENVAETNTIIKQANIKQIEDIETTKLKRQFGYRLTDFSNSDIYDYIKLECNEFTDEIETIAKAIKTLTITESDYLTPQEINNKIKGVLKMTTINKEGTTYVGTLTKEIIRNKTNFIIDELTPARQQVFNELLINTETPNTLRSIISITDDEHVETIPALTYLKSKLEGKGIELKLNNTNKTFLRREGLIYTRISDTIVHNSDKILDETLKEIFTQETINYESLLLLDKENESGLIDDNNKDISLYKQQIKKITHSQIYAGIRNAIKDIPQSFRHTVSIVMNNEHYETLINELAILQFGSLAIDLPKLFNVTNVVITDDAKDIFIGDFKHGVYAKYRATSYMQRKNAEHGLYELGLHFVFDIKVVPQLLRMLVIE
ncbi:phage capsid protein [Staphylococcus hominis]|uniref:phage capsid protein n=1 Tax=Staphylococcus hominis TaxID=1290 RepID=UPI002DD68005|nr:phage capsid protein [Staphylococcus hominis]WRY66459.1 phage capsid protein [Staphylococcus hominis]